jgi:hypothetical protein
MITCSLRQTSWAIQGPGTAAGAADVQKNQELQVCTQPKSVCTLAPGRHGDGLGQCTQSDGRSLSGILGKERNAVRVTSDGVTVTKLRKKIISRDPGRASDVCTRYILLGQYIMTIPKSMYQVLHTFSLNLKYVTVNGARYRDIPSRGPLQLRIVGSALAGPWHPRPSLAVRDPSLRMDAQSRYRQPFCIL